ncbi:MAG: hypothetical protein AAF725_00395 [Acidobacteriota bacterium]
MPPFDALPPGPWLLLLLGSLVPLALGPLLATWADRSGTAKAAVDAFIAVSITGIVALHIWPHAFLVAGAWSLLGGLIGLLLPFLLHGALHAHERRFYPLLMGLALLGLALHATLDGIALFAPLLDSEAAQEEIYTVHGKSQAAHALEEKPAELEAAHEESAHQHAASEHRTVHAHGESDAAHPMSEAEHEHPEAGHAEAAHAAHGEVAHEEHAHAGDPEACEASAAAGGHHHHHDGMNASLLAGAVLLHRLPMGLAIWWLTVPILGRRVAISVLALIAAGTLAGFALGGALLPGLSAPAFSFFEATIAGMLMHVVAGHDHRHHHGAPRPQPTWAAAAGARMALARVGFRDRIHPAEHRFAGGLDFQQTLTALALSVGPWLILAIAVQCAWQLTAAPRFATGPLAPDLVAGGVISLALLGVGWTLLGAIAALLVAACCRRRRPRDSMGEESSAAPAARRITLVSLVWAGLAIGLVALLESLVRLPWLQTAEPTWSEPGSWLAVAAAALAGLVLCRHPIFAVILGFYWLTSGYAPALVATFFLAGVLGALWRQRRTLEFSTPRAAGAAVAGGGALLLLAARLGGPEQDALLAAGSGAPWQIAALYVLGAAALGLLFLLGFRGFLSPVLEPAEDYCHSHAHHHG